MTALAVRSDPSQTLPAKIAYAKALADSGLLPAAYRAQPANVLYAVEYGDMLGLPPMAAITGIHIIEGKPSASSGLISALVRRAGHKLRVTGNDKEATAHIVRADDPDFTFEARWTLERAKAADLAGKGTWKKYPAAMLKARAISEVARAACEEALFGLHYTPEELGAEVDEDGGVVGGVVVGEAAPVPAAAPAEDLWQTPAPESTDQEWLTAALGQAVTVTSKEAGEKLWVEGAERQQDGRITPADAKRVADLLRARFAELKAGAAEVVDAEAVEAIIVVEDDPADGLDPGDPWAAKVEDITCLEDAAAALADLNVTLKNGSVAGDRFKRVEAAIEAKCAAIGAAVAA
jgi:hypothetical protein